MPIHRVITVVCVALFGVCATAAPPATQPIQTGAISLTFDQKSALSDAAKIAQRAGWPLESIQKQIDINYDLAQESYNAFVPPAYDGTEPYGLFVYISAGDDGGPPGDWKDVLTRHKIIWIGARKAGNKRAVMVRIGLAFDAVEGMKARYKIDPKRIYISGTSGGGKVASVLGVEYPEVFNGGFYFIGADFYRPVPSTPGRAWPKAYSLPVPKLVAAEKRGSRHVLLTGEGDMNRDPIVAFAAAFKADGFLHVTLLDVPGLGHKLPAVEWFEKGKAGVRAVGLSVQAKQPDRAELAVNHSRGLQFTGSIRVHSPGDFRDHGADRAGSATSTVDLELGYQLLIPAGPAEAIPAAALRMPEYLISLCLINGICVADREGTGCMAGKAPVGLNARDIGGRIGQLMPRVDAANAEQGQGDRIGNQPRQRAADLIGKAGQRRVNSGPMMETGRIGLKGIHQASKRCGQTLS